MDGTGPLSEQASAQFTRYCRSADRAALEQALMACAPVLRREARRLRGAGDVDDLVHDCFVVAIRRASEFQADARLLPWLLGILQNLSRSRHRWRWWRLQRHSQSKAAEHSWATDDGPPVVDRDDWYRSVVAHLERVPEPYRTVVTEHLIHGVPLAQIAARLGRPANTVRSQFARGLQALRRRLPAPFLAGLTAVLATRSASAGSADAVPRRTLARSSAIGFLVLAALFVTWSSHLATTGLAAPNSALPQPQNAGTVGAAMASAPAVASRALASVDSTPTLTVRLHHPDGTPAAGIPVIFDPCFALGLPLDRAQVRWRIAATDASGVARFDLDTRGSAAIRLHDHSVLHRFEATDAPCHFSFPVQVGSDMKVALVDDLGQPVCGAAIHASFTLGARSPGWRAATSDSEGRAVIRPVLQQFTLWAFADGYTMSECRRMEAALVDSTKALTLRLARSSHRCIGTVVTSSGAPAANALVSASSLDRAAPAMYGSTDQSGWFDIGGLPEGRWSVAAFAEGFACASADNLGPFDEPRLVLSRGCTVSGVVDRSAYGEAQILRVVTRALDGDVRSPLRPVGTEVERDGRFRLPPLAAGEHEIGLFDVPDRTDPVVTERVIAVDGNNVEIRLSSATRPQWKIRVQDEAGRGLAGYLVRADNAADRGGRVTEGGVPTDADGVVRLPTADNAVKWLYVYSPQQLGHRALPTIGVGPVVPMTVTTITVPAAMQSTCRLRGCLPAGHMGVPGEYSVRLTRAGGECGARIEPDGSFVLDDVPAGQYELRLVHVVGIERIHLTLAKVTLEPGQDLDLGPLPAVSYSELNIGIAQAGACTPVPITLRDSAGNLVFSRSIESGNTVHLALPTGTYSLEYPDSTWSPRTLSADVIAATGTSVQLPRVAGRRCRIELIPDRNFSQHGILVGQLGPADSTGGSALTLLLGRNGRSWSADVDLQPGVYRFTALGGELRETLVVVARSELQTFPIRMP